ASAFDAETRKWTLRASYALAGSDFHRVMVPSLLDSESDKENVDATYTPNSFLSVFAGHHNLLQPLTLDSPMIQASMNDVGGSFRIAGLYFGAGFFTSSVSGRDTHGTNLYAGRRFRERFEVTGNYFESQTTNLNPNTMLTGTFRENLSPRFSL